MQPERRSHSWVATIREARRQIRLLQHRHPRFTEAHVTAALWEDCYAGALNEAEKDMNQAIPHSPSRTCEEVFETNYALERPQR